MKGLAQTLVLTGAVRAADLSADRKANTHVHRFVRRGIVLFKRTYLQYQTGGNPFASRPCDVQELAAGL